MYSINDTVLYGANGVCRVSDICQKEFSGTAKDYYILRPISNEALTIFVPVNFLQTRLREFYHKRKSAN